MKKLVVVTLVLAMAVVANASSVAWKFSTSSTYKDYTVYICSELASGGFKDVADIQSHLLGTEGNSGTITGSRTYLAQGAAGGLSANPGDTVNFYYVIVNPNDATGYWTLASSGEAYTTSSTHTDSAIPASDANALLATTKTAWATGGGGDVPEPTSGLLLLVGGAMLALRRKQK